VHGPLLALLAAGTVSLAAWTAILALPFRPWDLRPFAEEEPAAPEPALWPAVAVLVPARNEEALLPATLPALLAQDYPGDWRVLLVDDRSADGTAQVAEGLGDHRLEVVPGEALPQEWTGKVWALEQARRAAGSRPDYYLLTDADIRHEPASLRRLVAESEANGLALNSRMAKLHCRSPAERLLIPPFLYFFCLLYPPRLVNAPRSRVAAAAGGCVLLRREALEQIGGLTAIRDRLIDDVSLARAIKRSGGRIHLGVSRGEVVSLRGHDLGGAWRMVRRTAFEELRRSWLRVTAALAGLGLLFLLPPALLPSALAVVASGGPAATAAALGAVGACAWLASAATFLPAVRYFGLAWPWSLALPLAAFLYGGMTLDSALRGTLGRRSAW